MLKELKYNHSLRLFCLELVESIKSNNITLLKKAMESEAVESEAYGSLPKDKKEYEAFRTVYQSVFLFNTSGSLLQYLIFDYKVSEANSIDIITVDDTVKAMFEARKLTEELISELDDSGKTNKKLKV